MAIIDWGESRCDTSEILECIDPTEYLNLSDEHKETIRLVLSCATVDMNPNSTIRSWLFTIFPSGTSYNALYARFSKDNES